MRNVEPEVWVRAARLVREHQDHCQTVTAAVVAVVERLDVLREPIHCWLAQDDIDTGGLTG